MVEDAKEGKPNEKLDFTEFVKQMNYNRRWTYQGSLTTAPFSEGILWNVMEQVIPISQSTLDAFTEFKKIEDSQVVNKFETDEERKQFYKDLEEGPLPDHSHTMCLDPNCTQHRLFRTAFCSRPV